MPPLIKCLKGNNLKLINSIGLVLRNVTCGIGNDRKFSLLQLDIFEVFYKTFLDIFPLLPKKILPDNYKAIEYISGSVMNILCSDSRVIVPFLNSELCKHMQKGLEALIDLAVKSDDTSAVFAIEKAICRSFRNCSDEVPVQLLFIEVGVLETILSVLEEFVELEGKGLGIESVDHMLVSVHMILNFDHLPINNDTHTFRKYFDELDALPILLSFFELYSKRESELSENEKPLLNRSAVCVIRLFKAMRVPVKYLPCLAHIKKLMSEEGFLPRAAQAAWNAVIDPE
jgi:hypothetical protein